MKKWIAPILLMLGLPCAQATDTFNPQTGYLTIPSIEVGGATYSNVVVRINSYDIISQGGVTPPVSATCTASNINTATYGAIQAGMTFQQVTQIMGCANSVERTVREDSDIMLAWNTTDRTRWVFVYFDPTGTTVMPVVLIPGTPSVTKIAGGF